MNRIVYVGRHALTHSVSRHFHKSWELIFCTSGGGEIICEDKTLSYGVNEIAVIPPLLPHSNVSATGFTNIHVNLTDAAFSQTGPRIVPADPGGFLRNAFSAAFCYYSGASEEKELLLPAYGQLIAAHMSTSQPERRRSDIVQRIERHILENYPDCGYDVNLYLSSLPFSPEYLKRLFKKETGLTPHQYLTGKRLESAADTLGSFYGKWNISETARLCGFSEPLYFSRLFKRKFGMSPRDYVSQHAAPAATDPDEIKIML